ncbi:MAG: multidrug effflux MFS transporter [Hyphomonadaceae bacterium]|nr:multidrug effflux MFS transporter [Hyphomonadaceae bacterium]
MHERAAKPTLTLILVLGGMTAILALSFDLYLAALPRMGHDLQANPAAVQGTLSSYFIGLAVGQLLYGPVSDRVGRRPPVFFGLTVFIIASIGCALAPNVEILIALRFIQALGASSAATMARAIIGDMFELREGARFMSKLLLVNGLAPILAPYIGGWIVVGAGWRAVFYALALFALVLAISAFVRLPETRSKEAAAAMAGENPLRSYLAVVRNGPLMRASFVGALGSTSLFAYISYAPHLLISTYKVPTEQFGIYFGVNAIGLVTGAQVNRWLLGRAQPHEILNRSTFLIFGLALLLLIGATFPVFGMWTVLVPLFFLISTFPLVAPNAAAIALWSDRKRTGAVAAITGAISFVAGAIAAVVAGALFDGTAVPMAAVIVVAAGAALLLRQLSRGDQARLNDPSGQAPN